MSAYLNQSILSMTFLLTFATTPVVSQTVEPTDTCIERIDWLSTNCDTCLAQGYRRVPCVVQDFGPLGEVGHTLFYYGIYKTTLHYQDSSLGTFDLYDVSIFEQLGDSTTLRPIINLPAADFVDRIEAPYLIKANGETILHIFMTGGNGGFDFGYYLLRDQNDWHELNIPEWTRIFNEAIPTGYTFCRGGSVDFSALKVVFPVFKPDDACCCPTGGTVSAIFEINGYDVVVSNIKYSPGAE